MVAREAALKLLDEGGDGGVTGVEEEDLVGGDDGLDVLQVYHDRPLTPQHRRRVRQQWVQYPEITRRQSRPPHDRVLSGLHHLGLPRRVQQQPWPYTRRLLPNPADHRRA